MTNRLPNLEYHRGDLCSLRYQICQEGYCAECGIYRNNNDKRIITKNQVLLVKVGQPVLRPA